MGRISEAIDLAVMAVPSVKVLDVAKECGEKGIKNLVVVSAGFKEIGKEGLKLERDLLGICQHYGMRMLGPNCAGMMDTHIPINTSFAKGFPIKGDIAFFSQSGAMLVSILDWSFQVGLGFSKIVSLGNKADLSEIDFIKEAADDPYTKVILCYIEDVSDGNRFLEVVSQASRKKPVIIYKSGNSQAGARAASSHTGALAGSDLAYDVAFKQCGVIRARTITELFDLAIVFAKSPVPKGSRVGIVTNSGGPGIIASDNVEQKGLSMATFTKKTLDNLRRGLPAEAGIYNPVDVLGDAKADRYNFAIEQLCLEHDVDCLVVIFCPTATNNPLDIAQVLIESKRKYSDKAFFGAFIGGASVTEAKDLLNESGVPCFTFPEPVITTIKEMVKYGNFRDSVRIFEEIKFNDTDSAKVRKILQQVKRDNRLVLLGSEAAEVALAYGIFAAPIELAVSPQEAVEKAEEIGYPVVLKVASPEILHKTDVGGVKVGLTSAEQVYNAFIEITDSTHRYMPQAIIHGIEVQKMMPKGTELIVGMTKDVQFGPMIAVGLGGIYVNLINDVSFRLARGLSKQEIGQMIEETKAFTLLRGFRGEKAKDWNALVDTIGRISQLVMDFPEIAEIDINPVNVYEKGLSALDVKITIMV